MRLNEIKVIDLAEKAYLNMHTMLKNLNLLENNNNIKVFSNFIDSEKLNCIKDPKFGDIIFPLYLQSAPIGEIILGKYIANPSNFIRFYKEKCEFKNKNGDFRFPIDKYQGDGKIDLLIFDSFNNQQQFLSMLKLKFGNWNINITQADV